MKEKSPIEAFEHACIQLRTAQKQPDQMKVIMDYKGSDEEMVEELTEKRKCALDRLVRVVPQSESEQLQIVGTLLAEGEPEEARIACELAAEPEAVTVLTDPVVQLCERWLRTRRVWKEASILDQGGYLDSRDCLQFEQICDQLLEQIYATPPKTVEGIVRLLDVHFLNGMMDALPGTEGWEQDIKSDQVRMLRHVRNGAAHIAGLDNVGAVQPELGIHADYS